MAQRLIDRQNDLLSNNSSFTDFDLEGLETRLKKKVTDEAEKAKAIALQFLKDSNLVLSAAIVRATGTGWGASSSNTKKDAVQLPKFFGDEKRPGLLKISYLAQKL